MKLTFGQFRGFFFFLLTNIVASFAAAPDLIITEVWLQGTTICYQVQNSGDAVCSSSHTTRLYIDGQSYAVDTVTKQLGVGERLNRVFMQSNWTCSGTSHDILVLADAALNVAESSESNNERKETWTCDQQAPQITQGPTVTRTLNNYTITWKTDEAADSTVYYHRRVGLFNTKSDATLSQDHSITLTGLAKGVPYRYYVCSKDASGNLVESRIYYFNTAPASDTTKPQVEPPVCLQMEQPLFPLRFNVDASDNDAVDRVVFTLDGQLCMTDYDSPFSCYIDPGTMGLTADTYFGMSHTLAAEAIDRYDNSALNQQAWMERPRCPDMELEIELGACTNIYTPDAGISFFIGEIEIVARKDAGVTLAAPGSGPTPDVYETNWDEVDEVWVYYDDELIDTITPAVEQTNITCPLLLSYLEAPSTHDIKVKIYEGMCTKTSTARMRVFRQITDVTMERSVDRVGSAFNVTVTLTNHGTSSAFLDTLVEEAEGFQFTVPHRSLYDETVTYDPQTRRSRLELDFSDTLSAGDSQTYNYTAIPILSEGVHEYHLGQGSLLAYHDGYSRDYTIALDQINRVEGQRVEDAVDSACQGSDYLIVTNPVVLFGLHNDESVNELLAKAAQLAALRNGVLAYYLGAGSIPTGFRGNDKIACGNIIDDWKDEVVIMDESDDKIRLYNTSKQLTIYHDDEEFLPICHEGLYTEDVMLVGNIMVDADPANPLEEIIIVDGHSSISTRGQYVIYNYNTADDAFDKSDPYDLSYDPDDGDQIAVGDVIDRSAAPNCDEIIVFNSGLIEIYGSDDSYLDWWDCVYSAGDLVAAGDLIVSSVRDEIVIGDISEQEIVVYSCNGTVLHRYSCELESSDTLQVNADGLVLADFSEGRIYIRGVSSSDDWAVGSFDMEIPADDTFLCGKVLDSGIQQYLLAHVNRDDHYSSGDIDIFTYSDQGYAQSPGDRERLEELLNPGGEWADKMSSDFTDDGYLLLIGETEVIPAFSCSYELSSSDTRYIEFTDNYYGNTSGDMKSPEISVGRIIGTTIDVMKAPLQASLDIAAGDKELDFDRAYCISGGPQERFETSRSDVVEALEDKGWEVARHDEPSDDTFFANCPDRDAIYMAAHGNWNVCWDISSSNVKDRFDPGDSAPIVYASSCLTGRYPEGVDSFGETFLSKGASAYIGASENSISPYGRYLAEGFFGQLDLGSPVGSALKEAKRNRMGDGDYGKYMSAVYHFFGDPKLEAVSTAAAASSMKSMAQQSDEILLGSPPTTVQVTIPAFTVKSTAEGDIASIPGGSCLAEVGHPEVPSWPVQITLPKGVLVQNVVLSDIKETTSGTGLDLIVVQPQIDGETHSGPALSDPSAWSNRQYDWTVKPNPDGTSQLTVSIYPLCYWPESTNYTYFTQCSLYITYNTSTISINRLWTDHKVYNVGETVNIEMFLKNSSQNPVDVIAEAELVRNNDNSVFGLLVKSLADVQGLASSSWTWDSSSAPAGTYELKVRIKSLDGLLLAEQSTLLQMGKTNGQMQPVVTNPVCFTVGKDIKIHTGFTNTGQTTLNPRLIVEIYDAADGTLLERFESTTTNLAAGAEYLTHWGWSPTRARGSCRFKAYTLYDGKSTPVKFYPQLSSYGDGDFNSDNKVNLADFALLSSVWLSDDTVCDIAPDGGDCLVDFKDLNIIIDTWLSGIDNEGLPACNTVADINCDGNVDMDDLSYMSDVWLTNDALADIAKPADGIVNLNDFSVLSRYWLN